MTKVQKKIEQKQIIQGVFYIDSAKFLIDAEYFDKITIPNNIIEVDGDTGEQLREFKRNSIQVDFRGFKVYISNYTKVLPQRTYNKFMLLFSAKVSKRYLAGITPETFKAVLEHLRDLKYIEYKDSNYTNIIANMFTMDTDIAYNMIVPNDSNKEIIEQWREIRRNSTNKDKIKVGNAKNNQMIQFGKRGDKYFFKIYNKTLEIRSKLDEFELLALTPDERTLFKNNEYTMFRIEITIRNKTDFKSLNTSSKLVDLWQLLEHNNKDISKIVRRYYDEMTGDYKPKARTMSKLTSTDKMLLSFITEMVRNNKSFLEIINLSSSLFDDKQSRYRAKKKIKDLIDYYYTNDDSIKEQQARNMQSYKYIEQMFFLNS